MKNSRFDPAMGYVFGILILFLAGLMLLVIFGTHIYGQTVRGRAESDARRALVSYVSISIRNHDRGGAVAIEQGPEGDMLMLTDDVDGSAYITTIYLADGALVEEYRSAEKAPGTGAVQAIGACDDFRVTAVSDQCYRVTADGTDVLVHLRSRMEGAA